MCGLIIVYSFNMHEWNVWKGGAERRHLKLGPFIWSRFVRSSVMLENPFGNFVFYVEDRNAVVLSGFIEG